MQFGTHPRPMIDSGAIGADRGDFMHFFFDTNDGQRRITDNAGLDLPDEVEALEQAVSLLRDLSHVGVAPGAVRRLAVQVRAEDGRGLYAASLDLRVDRVD